MKIVEWHNDYFGDYDVFAFMDKSELADLKAAFPGQDVESVSLDGKEYYYWINSKTKIITPLPALCFAFGGQYNGYPPYGDKPVDISIDFKEYTFSVWEEKD